MALFSRWSSFQQVFRTTNNHILSKVYPTGSVIDIYKQCVHTERAESLSAFDKVEDERQNFIDGPVVHKEVISRLLKCSSLKEQLLTLPSILSLTPADIKQRHAIGDMVQDMLKPYFEVCKIDIFGSSVNSFGFKGCDIDMALEVDLHYKDLMTIANDDSEIPTIEAVLSGKVSPAYMSRLSSTDKLIFIHTVFLDYYKESTIAPIFINAYVPLIRFYHDFHQMKVDLTCCNRLALANTKLLHLYGQMDSRVIPLVMAVRYWAKNTGLSGGNLMFNSYCLTLLMIFFLQRRNPPVLPTFEQVLSLSDSIMSEDMRDTSYLKILTMMSPSSNTESLDILFQEFFFFYFYFDFEDVICPGNGQVVSRHEFSGAEYSKKFRYNTICVQDPIKKTHNVSNLVDFKHCKKFAIKMLTACSFFQGKVSPPSGLWGLAALLDDSTEPFQNETFDLKVPLDWAAEKRHCSSESALLVMAAQTVMDIFREALIFRVTMEGKGESKTIDKNMKDGEEELFLVSKLSGSNNSWLGRSNVKPEELGSSEDVLGLERIISLQLCERFEKIKQHNQRRTDDRRCDIELQCKFYGVKENGKLALLIKMAPVKQTRFNPILGTFLTDYIPRLMKKLL